MYDFIYLIYLLIPMFMIIMGFLSLNLGAMLISDCATVVAKRSGFSRFIIGMLVVSTLAALPEVLISISALSKSAPSLALGNAIGSHIVNISFIIGLSAVIMPLIIRKEMITRDAVFLLTITLVSSALILDGNLAFIDGIVLCLLFIPYLVNLITTRRALTKVEIKEAMKEVRVELKLIGHLTGKKITVRAGMIWLIGGIFLAVVGAEFVTRGGIEICEKFRISQWFVGISIVAIGGSSPDIMAAYHAARKGMTDLALAIGIGASTFTFLLTIGIVGILGSLFPVRYELSSIIPTVIAMNILTLLLVLFMISGYKLSRLEGGILLSGYIIYIVLDLFLF
ncbi:MAG: sodium:calcium antiporter [Candidatus Thermoplasmatota archaeon]